MYTPSLPPCLMRDKIRHMPVSLMLPLPLPLLLLLHLPRPLPALRVPARRAQTLAPQTGEKPGIPELGRRDAEDGLVTGARGHGGRKGVRRRWRGRFERKVARAAWRGVLDCCADGGWVVMTILACLVVIIGGCSGNKRRGRSKGEGYR